MAEQIQVFNVGTNSGNTRSAIASEQTLSELLLAFKTSSLYNEKQAKTLEKLQSSLKSGNSSGSGDAGSVSKGFRGIGDAADVLQDSLKNTPKYFQTFNNLLEHGAQKPVEVFSSGLKKVGNVAEGMAGYLNSSSKVFKYLGGGILAAGIGAVTTSFGILAGYLQNSLETFQDLSTYGGNFGNSMIDMRKAALMGNLTITEFSELVRENSRLFGTMGSSVGNGAAAFSNLSLKVRMFDQQRLKTLGFTVRDVNEMLVDYLDVTGRSGNLQDDLNNNQGKVIAGAVKFGTELTELSSITGINRKELAKSVKDQAARGEVTAALMRAQDRGVTNVNEKFAAVTTALTPFGPTVMKAAGDLLAFNGAFVTPESQALQRFMPALAGNIKTLNQSITSNTPGVDVAEAYKGNVRAMLDSKQKLIKMSGLNTEQGRWAQRFLAENAPMFAKYGQLQGKSLEDQLDLDAAEAKRRSAMTAGLSKLEEVFRNIRSKIEEKIINSKLFEKMSEYLSGFAEYFASPDFDRVFNNLIQMFDTGLKYMANIFSPEGRQLIIEDAKNMFNGLYYEFQKMLIGSSLYRYLTGSSEDEINAKLAAVDADKKATEIRREALKLENERNEKMKAFDPINNYVAWYQAREKAFKDYDLKIIELSEERLKAEKEAKKMWEKVNTQSAGQSIQDTIVDVFKTVQGWAQQLFSSEGRDVIQNHIIELFDKIAITIEGIFVRSKILRQFLSDETLENFRTREVTANKRTEDRAFGKELYETNQKIKDKQLELEKALNEQDKEIIKGELAVLKAKKEDIEANKQRSENEVRKFEKMSDVEKKQHSDLIKEKEDKESTRRSYASGLTNTISQSTKLQEGGYTSDKILGMNRNEINELKSIEPNLWGNIHRDWALNQLNKTDLETINRRITDFEANIPMRHDGVEAGYTESGYYNLDKRELVFTKDQQEQLRSTLIAAKELALSSDRSSLVTSKNLNQSSVEDENLRSERTKQLADFSKPDQEQYKAVIESKNILHEMKNNQNEFNESFLRLYVQNFDLTVQLQRDIENIADYYKHNR